MRVWSILGNSQRLDGGAMFGNVPKALWSRWVRPDEHNRIPLACRALLVEGLAGKTVLFETGIGAFFAPELRQRYGVLEERHVLLDSLAAVGLSDAEVDAVVLSHLHFDHAGGLLAPWSPGEPPRLLFPRARFIVGREAFARAKQPHPRDRASFIPELPRLLEESGRLELVDGEHAPSLGAAVRFHRSDGHTPGMLLAEIGASGGILFCADLIPGRPWVHLPVTMGYDRFPERLIDEKRAILEHALAADIRLFFTHDPGCAAARVRRDGDGRFTTAEERAELCGEPLH
jgi:glyoxylase-like metal-dependent hydrolase (beta-lactamase superfamily II)